MLLTFGDVFRYLEKEYVYLTQINQMTYAAEIYNKELTGDLVRERNHATKRGTEADKPLYCFVVLTTPPFNDRAAGVGFADKNSLTIDYPDKICSLSREDLDSLKKEIRDSRGVPSALREYVKDLDASRP